MIFDSLGQRLLNQNFQGKIEYRTIKLIGKGSEGQVLLAQFDPSKSIRLTKVMPTNTTNVPKRLMKCALKVYDLGQYEEQSIRKQAQLMENLQILGNQNIVSIRQHFKQTVGKDQYYVIVLEYCNGGTLEEELMKQQVFDRAKAFDIFTQLIHGLNGLHTKGIIHRDIKTANILRHQLKDRVIYKLCDFGLSRLLKENEVTTSTKGTKSYMSIEILKRQAYTSKADLWSLGVILYEMLYGTYPFSVGLWQIQQIQDATFAGFRLPAKIGNIQTTPEQAEFFQKIFCYEATRMSFRELSSSKFVQKFVSLENIQDPKLRYLQEIAKDYSMDFNNRKYCSIYAESLTFQLSKINYLSSLRQYLKIVDQDSLKRIGIKKQQIINTVQQIVAQFSRKTTVSVHILQAFNQNKQIKDLNQMIGHPYFYDLFSVKYPKEYDPKKEKDVQNLLVISNDQKCLNLLISIQNANDDLKKSIILKYQPQNDPIKSLETSIKLLSDCKLSYFIPLIINLHVLRILNSEAMFKFKDHFKNYLQWLQNHNFTQQTLKSFIDWTQQEDEGFLYGFLLKLENIKSPQ